MTDVWIPDTGDLSWACFTGFHEECTDQTCFCESPLCPHGTEDIDWGDDE